MTLIEAQHYGCVCIGFDTYASIHDIIEDRENGYIIKKHDINTFSQKLSCLMNNESEWQQMSEKSQADVNDKFNISLIVNKWENLLNEL